MFEAVRGVECLKAQRRRMQVASIRHPLFRRTDQGKLFSPLKSHVLFRPLVKSSRFLPENDRSIINGRRQTCPFIFISIPPSLHPLKLWSHTRSRDLWFDRGCEFLLLLLAVPFPVTRQQAFSRGQQGRDKKFTKHTSRAPARGQGQVREQCLLRSVPPARGLPQWGLQPGVPGLTVLRTVLYHGEASFFLFDLLRGY